MSYNHAWIIDKIKNGEEIDYIFFWGHQPIKDGRMSSSCFSQWFAREFQYKGISFPTAEHWMMAQKALLFGDKENLEKILNSQTPKEAKNLGRSVKNFDEEVWVNNREKIVKNGNYLKFKQNEDLWKFLNGTEKKVIVEASPYDKIWGIGMKITDKRIENPANWKGLNLLGFALMEVRDKLRNE